MHWKRVLVAAIFLPLFYFMVKDLPSWVFTLVVSVAILLGLLEFYRMVFGDLKRIEIPVGLIAGGILVFLHNQYALGFWSFAITVIIMTSFLAELFVRKKPGLAVKDGAFLLVGVFYVAWLLGHLLPLRALEQGQYLIFYLFLVTWSCDAGAYYAGKMFGRRALASRVSPNKTIEGAVGGLIFSVAVSLIARQWFLQSLSLNEAVGLGLLLSVIGQLGDLVESMIKRGVGVKDSGGIFPGHGGLLDKVDSLLFTTPGFYYYMILAK